MTFTEAINEICDGKKVTREEWGNKNDYGFMLNDQLSIFIKGKPHVWIVSYADMLAEDWQVV